MVALAVSSLVLGGDLGKAESAPVGEAANNTAGADNLGTGITGNPIDDISRPVDGESAKI